jgi:hypothetical protein
VNHDGEGKAKQHTRKYLISRATNADILAKWKQGIARASDSDFAFMMHNLREKTKPEFDGRFPVMRVNWYKFHVDVMDFVTALTTELSKGMF